MSRKKVWERDKGEWLGDFVAIADSFDPPKDWFVYLIQEERASKKAPVKIGVSCNVDIRLTELQTGNPRKLVLRAKLGPMGQRQAYSEEKRLHRRFKCQRLRGEWFSGLIIRVLKKEQGTTDENTDTISLRRDH